MRLILDQVLMLSVIASRALLKRKSHCLQADISWSFLMKQIGEP